MVAILEQVFRDEWGRVLAALIGFLGDFELAEEAAQEAFAIAAERWPRHGQPANPRAWLVATATPGALHYGTQAEIHGPALLNGRPVRCLDIRAGAGVVLAGLIADGETVVSALHHLDRGYEGFVDKLCALNADVEESIATPAEVAASV